MWTRVPVLVRALLAAVAVTGTVTVVWGVLIQSNLRFSPKLPWAAPIMAAFLVYYWKFLKGWGRPQSTAAVRRTGDCPFIRPQHESTKSQATSIYEGEPI